MENVISEICVDLWANIECACGLFKKKDKDYFGIEGDEESSMFEDSVSPAK